VNRHTWMGSQRNVRSWPDSANLGDAASRGYLGYTGRAANVIAKAALDPKATLRAAN
jgi:hypothetical protein